MVVSICPACEDCDSNNRSHPSHMARHKSRTPTLRKNKGKGVGLIIGLSFTFPMPLTSLPELSPVLSIRAGSGLGPRWGQVDRLAACFHQPLLIVGRVQPFLVPHLIGPRGLTYRGTVVPPGVRRPCLVTEVPLWLNGNQGGWKRVMRATFRRQGSPSINEDHAV